VNLASQVDSAGQRYLLLNGSSKPTLELVFTSMTPQRVDVSYNSAAKPLDVKERTVLIKANVHHFKSADVRFERPDQTLLPIEVKLLPATGSAKTVATIEPNGRTVVVEGATVTYDVYLRPCTPAMKSGTVLFVAADIQGEVNISPNRIQGDVWGNTCKVEVQVTAVDDAVSEGLHFVNLRHTVVDENGNRILLSDGSTLYVDEVLVEIYDNDISEVIIEQTKGYTAVSEVNVASLTGVGRSYYQDTYAVRLSRQPRSDVQITVSSKGVSSDRNYPSTDPVYTDFLARKQVLVGISEDAATSESVILVFTALNWQTPQVVHVAANDDAFGEGVKLMNFAPQPSYLSYVQGPLTVSASTSASYRPLAKPMMMFMWSSSREYDDATFGLAPGPYASPTGQKENLEIYNLDVRGVDPSTGILTDSTFTGFDLSSNLVIGGITRPQGITYTGIEVLEIRLGDGVDILTVVNVTRATQLLIRTRAGSDSLYFEGLAPDARANVYGDDGDDTIYIDGTDNWRQSPVNLLVATRLRWSGGNGDDTMHIKLSSLGTSDIDIFNDLSGVNDVNIDCPNTRTVMLSRENLLANIHDTNNPSSTVERINLIRESDQSELLGFRNTAVINTLVLRLNGGTNVMYFDDTFAPMDVYGGPLVDGKWFEMPWKASFSDHLSYLFLVASTFVTTNNFTRRILYWTTLQIRARCRSPGFR